MRIVHCVPQWGVGGVWVASSQLAAQLRTVPGVRVDVLSVAADSDASASASGVTRTLGWKEVLVARASRSWLREIADTAGVVHLHSMWHPELALLAQACKQHAVPYVVSPHGALDRWALRQSRLKKAAGLRLYQKAVLRGASVVHCLTRSEQADVIRLVGTVPCAVVPNGIEMPAHFTQLATDRPTGVLHALFLSRLDPKKNLEALLRALPVAARSGVRIRLRVAGTGDPAYVRKLMRLTSELGLEDAVSFVGNLHGDAKRSELEAADALVLPSFSEGLSMAVLEALSVGTPVVVTPAADVGGVADAGAGIVCTTAVESISDALQELAFADSEKRGRLRLAARKMAEERFGWKTLLPLYVELYRRALTDGALRSADPDPSPS